MLRISQEHEEKTNGAYGSRSQSRYRLVRGGTVKGERSLVTPDKRSGMYGFHFISSSKRHHHHHHHHHPYRRSKYIPDELKKSKPPTFDGEIKKAEDVEASLLEMKKLFIFHNYSENMKAKITTFNLKGKENI